MLTRDRGFRGQRRVWACGLLNAVAAILLGAAAGQAARADDEGGFGRLDPETGRSVLVPFEKLRRGNIYSHIDQGLKRRVWSHYLGDGRFGIALGVGTTQNAKLFDIQMEQREALDLLRRWDPKLAEDTVREGTEIFLKLAPDQHWRVTRTTVAMIYDPAAGYRFEQQFGKYVPVCHLDGFKWRPEGADFGPTR